MVVIDTNIVMRYLLQDHEELSRKATQIIEDNEVICSNEVVYEVFHVLTKVYEVSRDEAINAIKSLFDSGVITSFDRVLTLQTLEIMQNTSMDFIDCLLIAHHIKYGRTIASFDKKVNNYIKRWNEFD